MKRYIEINDEKNIEKHFTTDELPFEVIISPDLKDKFSLIIAKIDKDIEDLKKTICGYIAQDEGHLFFQPVGNRTNNNELEIFHNNELIDKSVWLKSGDIIEINSKIITYNITGDKIKINVVDKPSSKTSLNEDVNIIPPPRLPNNLEKKQINNLPEVNIQSDVISSKNITKKRLLIGFSILLIIMSSFILFAETASISIEPEADEIKLSGIFPTLKINKRYILLSGDYDLSASKHGYKKLNKSLHIDSKNKQFSFVMIEKPGVISFNITADNNNEIYVDNVLLGKIKKTDVNNKDNDELSKIENETKNISSTYEINRGQHNVLIVNPRYKKLEQLIQVEGKNIFQQFDFKLEPNWGYLRLSSETQNTLINIYSDLNDDEPVYSNKFHKTTDIELVAGHYTVRLSKEKYKDKIENFSIDAGDKRIIEIIKLEPKDARINLTSKPGGSLIRVDGQYKGKTPQSLILSSNEEHEIELSLSGYKDIRKIIKLKPDEIIEQDYKLEGIKGLVFITVIPAHATLTIDGKKQIHSSGKFNLAGNDHMIQVKAKGYKTQIKKINASTYSKNISFNLLKINSAKKSTKHGSKQKSKQETQVKSRQTKTNNIKNKQTADYKNSIKQKMILIKPATFIMGSKKNEAGRGSNEREYKVTLTKSYYLSDKEISNKQFRQFKASHNSAMISGLSLNTDNQPVVNIVWNEAAKFANWLSKKEGLKLYYKDVNGQMLPIDLSGKINGYRLPFESEWVLAAKGTQNKKYPWSGNFPPKNSASGNFADESARAYVTNVIEGYNDQQPVSAPIGSFSKNSNGFYDMGGNISEWCQDYYTPYSGLSGSVTSGNGIMINPTGPKKGTHKVVKDSSWRDASITELRLSYRSYSKKKAKDIGFRVARYAQ